MQALKKYMNSSGSSENNSGGGSGGSASASAGGGGDFQSKLIGLAMSEAATLFDKTGHTGDKQDAVNGAASTMFKLLVQSKVTGSGAGGGEPTTLTGGSNSGGLNQLLEMVCTVILLAVQQLNNAQASPYTKPK